MAEDRNRPITLADLDRFATKDDLEAFATKDDLKNVATRDDFARFATKADFAAVVVELASLRGEFRDFRSEFSDFKTWTQTTLDRVVTDISDLKQEMVVMRDSRLRRIHDRLTRVEEKVDLPPEEYY